MIPGKGAELYVGSIMGGDYDWGCLKRLPVKGESPTGELRPESLTLHKVPTWCNLRIGARYWPGQTSQGFVEAVNKWIGKAREEDPSIDAEVRVVFDGNEPFAVAPSEEIVKVLKSATKYVTGKEPATKGYSMMTDAPYYCAVGIPTVLWHPIGWPRLPVPWITIDELATGCKVYTAVVLSVCSREEYRL